MFLSMERQALHAFSLRFKHPITGKIETFEVSFAGRYREIV